MRGDTDWHAANDHPKGRLAAPPREWVRPRGETWYRRAEAAAENGETGPAPAARPRHVLVTASRVVGSSIYTADGRRLGRVAEIALDEATGGVEFVVVASGGFLGFGGRQARVPWTALSYEPQRSGYVLDLPSADLEALSAARAKVAFQSFADRGGWAAGA